ALVGPANHAGHRALRQDEPRPDRSARSVRRGRRAADCVAVAATLPLDQAIAPPAVRASELTRSRSDLPCSQTQTGRPETETMMEVLSDQSVTSTSPIPERTAVLLIAHGSRESTANDDLNALAARLAASGEHPIVVSCFLELAEPDIPTGGERCVA